MKIVSYYNAEDTTGKERGMISMFAILATVFVFSESPMYKFISEN